MIGLSDKELYDRFGDIMHEIPELALSLRVFELEKRPAVTLGAFEIKTDWMTISSAAEGLLVRLLPANSR